MIVDPKHKDLADRLLPLIEEAEVLAKVTANRPRSHESKVDISTADLAALFRSGRWTHSRTLKPRRTSNIFSVAELKKFRRRPIEWPKQN